MGAAAANQQHFHRQIFGLGLNFSLNIMEIFVTGNFNIQPDDRLLRGVPPLGKLFADAGEIAFQHCQRLRHRHRQRKHLRQVPVAEGHQIDAFAFARLIKAEGDGRAAVANMVAAADLLRPVNMAEGNIINGGKMAGGERLQRADVDIAHRIALAGANGGQVAAGDDRQRTIAAQGAGGFVLLLIIVADSVQQQLLFFAAGVSGLAGDQLARAQEGDRAKYGAGRAVALRQNKGSMAGAGHHRGFQKGQNIAGFI